LCVDSGVLIVGFGLLGVDDLYGLSLLLGEAFEELIGVDFALLEFFNLLHHLSLLPLDFLLHQLSLVEQLVPLPLDLVGFGHLLLDLVHEFFLFILLHLHDPFDVVFFVSPLQYLLIVLF